MEAPDRSLENYVNKPVEVIGKDVAPPMAATESATVSGVEVTMPTAKIDSEPYVFDANTINGVHPEQTISQEVPFPTASSENVRNLMGEINNTDVAHATDAFEKHDPITGYVIPNEATQPEPTQVEPATNEFQRDAKKTEDVRSWLKGLDDNDAKAAAPEAPVDPIPGLRKEYIAADDAKSAEEAIQKLRNDFSIAPEGYSSPVVEAQKPEVDPIQELRKQYSITPEGNPAAVVEAPKPEAATPKTPEQRLNDLRNELKAEDGNTVTTEKPTTDPDVTQFEIPNWSEKIVPPVETPVAGMTDAEAKAIRAENFRRLTNPDNLTDVPNTEATKPVEVPKVVFGEPYDMTAKEIEEQKRIFERTKQQRETKGKSADSSQFNDFMPLDQEANMSEADMDAAAKAFVENRNKNKTENNNEKHSGFVGKLKRLREAWNKAWDEAGKLMEQDAVKAKAESDRRNAEAVKAKELRDKKFEALRQEASSDLGKAWDSFKSEMTIVGKEAEQALIKAGKEIGKTGLKVAAEITLPLVMDTIAPVVETVNFVDRNVSSVRAKLLESASKPFEFVGKGYIKLLISPTRIDTLNMSDATKEKGVAEDSYLRIINLISKGMETATDFLGQSKNTGERLRQNANRIRSDFAVRDNERAEVVSSVRDAANRISDQGII